MRRLSCVVALAFLAAVQGCASAGDAPSRQERIADLVRQLRDEDPEKSGAAAGALLDMGAREAVPDLLAVARKEKDSYPVVSVDALKAAVRLGGKDAVPYLMELLRDRESLWRQVGAMFLGELRAKEAVPALVTLQEDGEGVVRAWAAVALVEVGAPDKVAPRMKDELKTMSGNRLVDGSQAERIRKALQELGAR